ncbi:TonB-dependent receptor [Labilibaculum sp. A4]|uniref:outer membrane beta-barrel family protein n=1 Tax=Labilibaculum euxinus TaxID=2686357 RepID=UPI000F61DB01|nr:outer membrane beta-barrel family protein [Labilibaculum euxinus]MDQ1772522.1 TonB-dependent receptor [Labilibaculum euxinus]MWN78192.1 TonB-dependent receptor [Labilibaculum euxinus]
MNRLILLICLSFIVISAKAEEPVLKPEMKGGVIKGIVMDNAMDIPVEYATVSVYNMADSSLIDGTITDEKGAFELAKMKPGKYFVEITFIGYNKAIVRNIPINRNRNLADLKIVNLRQASEALNEVVVTSERAPVQYQIDKKVIPVSRQITAASGTAVDVLENVPSVSVDIEGNVSLRGNSNFTVLVDGKPSILDASDILQQMPASVIENIEIITNPSAKYDPEGTAGIINIITKKNTEKGLNGVANLSMGSQENRSGDILINYRKKKWNWNLGLDYSNRQFEGTTKTENRTIYEGVTSSVLSDGEAKMKRLGYGIRTGFDFDIDSKNQISFGFRYGNRDMERGSVLDYQEFNSTDPERILYDSEDLWEKEMTFVNSNFSYTRKFSGKGHQLASQVTYSHRGSGDEQSTNELFDANGNQTSGKIATEDGPGTRWEIRSDYTLPLGKDAKFELGYQGQIRSSEADTKQEDYNVVSKQYEPQPLYSHDVTYDQQVHGLYTTYASKIGKFGYQLGFRSEYTNREIDFKDESEIFTIKRWDFFPTIHTQMDLGSDNQLMASYTRRIQRPRGYWLEPFVTWTDAYNVRQGNPDLNPEYIDSYELAYSKRFGDQSVTFETYYKVTHNKIESVRYPWEEQGNVMKSTSVNVGNDYSLGMEATINLSFGKWFKNDLIGNFYHYKEEGDFTLTNSSDEDIYKDFSTKSYNWSLRNNSTIIFDPKTRVQFTANYQSETNWAQGKRKGFFTTSAALKRDFMKRRLSATFQVRDIFGTAKHETLYEGDNFYNFSRFSHKSPTFNLKLSFKINNYKMKRERGSEGGVDVEEFEM